jgi:DNA-binding transcriptional MerR regulator
MDEELELTRAQLAQRIGFSQSVIRKWEKDFSEFVTSPAGVKGLAKARVYNLDDVLLFGTIAQLRSDGLPLNRIRELLPDRLAQARAKVDEALDVPPLDAALGEGEPPARVQLTLYVDTLRQLEATEGELKATTGERDYLRERLAELEDKLVDAERRAARAEGERDMLAGRPPSFWQRVFGGGGSRQE